MDKVQKFEQTQKISNYLEENQVQELFLGLLKQLLVQKPEKPLDFIIDKLSIPPTKRMFLLGPSGSGRKGYCKTLRETFNINIIETGSLLQKEVQKQTEHGKKIEEGFKARAFVDDEVVFEIVKKKIADYEKEGKDWIIEGFPRNKNQALMIGKLGIIPDKMVLLKTSQDKSTAKIKQNLLEQDPNLQSQDLETAIRNIHQEYNLNILGVQEVFKNFMFEIDASKMEKEEVESNLINMLKIRFSKNSPRRPPKIVIQGPPGSGRTTQAKLLAQQYGLIRVSTEELLDKVVAENPDVGRVIRMHQVAGKPVPDGIINSIVEQRLKASDCRVNGWVMEGFPETEAQCNLLKAMNVTPSVVFMLEQSDEQSLDKLGKRRIDPKTGKIYNLALIRLADPHLSKLISDASGDAAELAKLGLRNASAQVVETLILDSPDADPIDSEILSRLAAREEDAAPIVKQKVQDWKLQSAILEDYYPDKLATLDAGPLGVRELQEHLVSYIQDAWQ